MAEPGLQIAQFKLKIRELFRKETLYCRAHLIANDDHVYTCGDQDPSVYFIESGQIKLTLLSPDCKESIVAVLTGGDIFGEASLYGQVTRAETAAAMQETQIRKIAAQRFLALLKRESLLEELVGYLAARVTEQQEVITSLLTVNSEHRLAMNLLQLGRRLGRRESCNICLEQKFSQEELAKMVGTTRTRVGVFLKRFRQMGLIGLDARRRLVIEESKLSDFLSSMAVSEKPNGGRLPGSQLSRLA